MKAIIILVAVCFAILRKYIYKRRLFKKLDSPDPAIRLDAFKRLGTMLESPIVRDRLFRVAEDDENASIRANAIKVIAGYLYSTSILIRPLFKHKLKQRAFQIWLKALRNEYPEVREAAIIALGKSKAEANATMKPLLNALDDPDAGILVRATAALANVCSSVKTIIFSERDDKKIFNPMFTVYNPDVSKLTVPMPGLENIVIDVETCETSQVSTFARYMLTYLDDRYLKHSVTVRFEGNPTWFDTNVYEACTRCKSLDVSIETVIFGSLRVPPHDPYTIVYDPDVSTMTIPMPRLNKIIIYTDSHNFLIGSHNFLQLERFLTYAVSYIGQNHFRRYVDVHIYGDPEHLHPNLRNNLTDLCKSVNTYRRNQMSEMVLINYLLTT